MNRHKYNILDHYEPIPECGCWIYLGAWWGNGYGKSPSGRRGKSRLAHRVFFEAHVGPIPDGMFVCHKCDTPACVNPSHLFLGTAEDNNRDRFKKGRFPMPFGPLSRNWKGGVSLEYKLKQLASGANKP